jgi:hypothetical protein
MNSQTQNPNTNDPGMQQPSEVTISSVSNVKRHWTKEEDYCLVKSIRCALNLNDDVLVKYFPDPFPCGCWAKVMEIYKFDRSLESCKQRWRNHVRPWCEKNEDCDAQEEIKTVDNMQDNADTDDKRWGWSLAEEAEMWNEIRMQLNFSIYTPIEEFPHPLPRGCWANVINRLSRGRSLFSCKMRWSRMRAEKKSALDNADLRMIAENESQNRIYIQTRRGTEKKLMEEVKEKKRVAPNGKKKKTKAAKVKKFELHKVDGNKSVTSGLHLLLTASGLDD